MKFAADFHIHSKYSRATSPSTDLENLDMWAKIKGIKVLGTGDFTHPAWIAKIKEKLSPAEEGLFEFRGAGSPTRFLLTTEVSCIYKKGGRVRKVHLIIFAPNIESVEKINKKLNEIGNIKSDGRPILGLDSKELLKIVLDANEKCMVVPAHAWTPWFSVFGSKSGFDSLGECFDEYSKFIYAIETGLSSDPAMNWRLSQLDNIALISNSDSHSPQKIGREANIFNTEMNYNAIYEAIKNKDKNKFLNTIEFFPEEGKYHFDGHASCGVCFMPKESKKHNNICPVCKKPLVIGVLNRVEELADRPEGYVLNNVIPYRNLIPLQEIIADGLGMGIGSKKVQEIYNSLLNNLGNELYLLVDADRKDIERIGNPEIAEGVMRAREGKVFIEPGYDGIYGKISLFKDCNGKNGFGNQKALF